ncbi:glycoside hydrolase family 55 protein [Bacillus sp. NEB1478]|uniref:glycoside hydrolase family 55 protein n=1 Tax=Bacillus sp. NEB1478 TaxID=3073816 RepID=UPI0028730600|nr:glycoside hydrolase family 55 protein [Bacillus sp. NEB1478]WNB92153.1 glycoside hydrolase family 55 protein [Bacillus sp. NEB1478]
MIQLNKNHDPKTNDAIIKELLQNKISLKEILKETDLLFKGNCTKLPLISKKLFSFSEWLSFSFKRFLVKKADYFDVESTQLFIDSNDQVFPEWIGILDKEYKNLLKNIQREVNVIEYGAKGDGITDDTEAFEKAIGKGSVIVRVPKGIYLVKGLKLPSYTSILGEGKGVTTIKLHDGAPVGQWLLTNKNHIRGNRNILVENMTLDWNVERLRDIKKTSSGNNRSSCLTFANVTYGWAKGVEAINPGLHCFDISSSIYTYFGDGTRSRRGSKYIWLDDLTGFGFGDDGITTHHSDYIFISNSHMCDPSGRSHQKGFSNSNGFEIDDGSRNVWLLNNSSTRCFGGIEVKAHHNASAAANVHIIGHLSVNDNRAYNFRHIGHHKGTEPESKTAYHISATNIVAIAPVVTDLYKGSEPRGMVISGYKNVLINRFLLLGDPSYDFQTNPLIAIQYRARNVSLFNVTVKDFHNSGASIKVFGGSQRADDILIQNVVSYLSTPPVEIGSNVVNAAVDNIVQKTTPLFI